MAEFRGRGTGSRRVEGAYCIIANTPIPQIALNTLDLVRREEQKRRVLMER